MSILHKPRIAVLRGGPSPEYDVSLNTGLAILSNIPEEYEALDVFVSKEGVWHTGGMEKKPYQILKHIDLAINGLHGTYGEDGKVQKVLESFNVPYTGSSVYPSILGMNKLASKKLFKNLGLKTPNYVVVEKGPKGDDSLRNWRRMVDTVNESFPFPIVIKPLNSGSSLGISLVDRSSQIKEALEKAFQFSHKILVEEYINGKEVTCGVIDGFRGEDLYPLLPVEIVKKDDHKLFHYDLKYNPDFAAEKHRLPAHITESEKEEIQRIASQVHKNFGLRDYSRSDFIIHPKRGIFVLEVNTLPEISHRSSFVKSLEHLGGNLKEFLSHLINKALKR